jgi:uncharacterized repeat protein (TIGR03803 family)
MALLTPSQVHAAGFTLVHSFAGGTTDGSQPVAGLAADSSGNMYGVTQFGGAHSVGTVFEVTSLGTYCKIYDFTSTNANTPVAALVVDNSGNLWGTAQFGGAHLSGGVFKLSGGSTDCSGTIAWTYNTIYDFKGTSDANTPRGSVLLDSLSSPATVYTTGSLGGSGSNNNGAVVKLSLSMGTWSETILYSFAGGTSDGSGPWAGLVMDTSNILYGTTRVGGTGGSGTAFKIKNDGTGYKEIYDFGATAGDVTNPRYGTLLLDSSGNLYGTAYAGGHNGNGGVFELSPGTPWTEVVYKFAGNNGEGYEPQNGLLDTSGTFSTFWVTASGGGAHSVGAIDEFTLSGGTWTLSGGGPKYDFAGGTTDCGTPESALIVDGSGNKWGTTEASGAHSLGCLFKFN